MLNFISHTEFSYEGRISFDGAAPLFVWPGSMARIRFTGTKVLLRLKNFPMNAPDSPVAVGAVIDGVQYRITLGGGEGEQIHVIAQSLPDGEHELVLFKRQAALHYFHFLGIYIDELATVRPFTPQQGLRLEVFGDSVSAGEGVEALYHTGAPDPAAPYGTYDNAWFSYPMVLARKLNAALHLNAQGGIALLHGTGYFGGENGLVGLAEVYDKLSYVPYSPFGVNEWDFTRYTPDYVVIAVGQNDAHPDPEAINQPEYRRRWADSYKDMVLNLYKKYKISRFILITTLLQHAPVWDEMLDFICAELCEQTQSDAFLRCRFRRCGTATPGHPRVSEQEEMAAELELFIEKDRGEQR